MGTSLIERFFARYHEYLTGLAREQIGERLRRKIDPGDIVQETFLEAHRQAARFRGTSDAEVVAWLKRILAGQLAMTWRRYLGTRGRDIRLEREFTGPHVDLSRGRRERQRAGEHLNPSGAAMLHEETVMLAAALGRLRRDYREVMILRYVEALSLQETAARLERSEDAVQKLAQRAALELRSQLPRIPKTGRAAGRISTER